MIELVSKVKYLKINFSISFFKIESTSDLDYLVILLSNKAIKENKELEVMLKEFTKGNNDYFLILKKRFEDIFKLDISKFLDKKEEIFKSKENKQISINCIENKNFLFYKDIKKFLWNDEYIDITELKSRIKEKYTSDDMEFSKLERKEKIVTHKKETFYLSNDFQYFDIKNLKKQKTKEIINNLILELKNKSYEFLPKEIDNYKNIFTAIKTYDKELEVIRHPYIKGETKYIEVIDIEDNLLKNKISMNINSNKEEIIISSFYLYQKVPFVKNEKMNFEKFKTTITYKNLLKIIENKNEDLDKSFKKTFIKYADLKEELLIIKNNHWFIFAEEFVLEKIKFMLNHNINFIDDDYYVKKDLFFKMNKENSKDYYNFVNKFYPNLISEMSENNKVDLLYRVLKTHPKTILPKDKKWITEFLDNKQKIWKKAINIKDYFVSERGFKEELEEHFSKYKKNNFGENNKNDEQIESWEKESKFWFGVINFCAHFAEKEKKKNKKLNNEIEKEYPNLIEIKNRYFGIKQDDQKTLVDIKEEDLSEWNNVNDDYKKFKKKIKKSLKLN